jgi:dynamin-like GTPase MGM1, mitochondrial
VDNTEAAYEVPFPQRLSTMSGRLFAAARLLNSGARRASVQAVRHYHHRLSTGGLQGANAAIRATRRRNWFPGNSYHNAVIVRNVSFARLLPKLVVKFIRIPALFGGVMIGGVAWIQYQAISKHTRRHGWY